MLLSLESHVVVGAFVVPLAGATRAFHNRSGTHRPAGVGEHGQTGIGVPQELGSSCCFHGRIPGWGYRVTNPRPDVAARSDAGSEMCVVPWYRQVKETKRGGKGGRKSQCLDSTDETGELDPRGPGGWEARHRVTTTVGRKHLGGIELPSGVTEMAMDSERRVCHDAS